MDLSRSPPPEAAPASEDAQEPAGASRNQNFLGCRLPSPQALGRAPAGGQRGRRAVSPPPSPPPLALPPAALFRARGGKARLRRIMPMV